MANDLIGKLYPSVVCYKVATVGRYVGRYTAPISDTMSHYITVYCHVKYGNVVSLFYYIIFLKDL